MDYMEKIVLPVLKAYFQIAKIKEGSRYGYPLNSLCINGLETESSHIELFNLYSLRNSEH